jgi:hypothetical protein
MDLRFASNDHHVVLVQIAMNHPLSVNVAHSGDHAK